MHATRQSMHAGTVVSFKWLGDTFFVYRQNVENIFDGSLSTSDFVCSAVVAQNMYIPTHTLQGIKFPMSSSPLPASETAPSPTLKMTCQFGPGAFNPKNDRGEGAFTTVWPGRFSRLFFFDRGRLLRILFVLLKIASLNTIGGGVYSH